MNITKIATTATLAIALSSAVYSSEVTLNYPGGMGSDTLEIATLSNSEYINHLKSQGFKEAIVTVSNGSDTVDISDLHGYLQAMKSAGAKIIKIDLKK